MLKQNITIPYDEIAAFCERHHIVKLSFFGSVLRDDFRADSDIDVLVEFDPNSVITYLDMADIEIELSKLFERRIDLREADEIGKFSRQKVLSSALLLYERK